jgi:hypothetical protein
LEGMWEYRLPPCRSRALAMSRMLVAAYPRELNRVLATSSICRRRVCTWLLASWLVVY